jgi:hypothetical protein
MKEVRARARRIALIRYFNSVREFSLSFFRPVIG